MSMIGPGQGIVPMRLTSWRKPKWIHIFLLMVPAVVMVRFLDGINQFNSAPLYLGVPYLVAVGLLYLTPDAKPRNHRQWFFRHLRNSLIVLLGTGVLLQEGFVCVVLFAPIYFAVLLLVLLGRWLEGDGRAVYSPIIAGVVALLSLEGVTGFYSFEREESVTRSVIVQQTPAQLRRNMAMPFDFTESRHWLLRLFPLPSAVEAGSLNPGDLHTVHFTYHRWFVTNTHIGEMKLRIVDVEDDGVTTRVESNTGYLANYMMLHGTRVRFEPVGPGATRVSLTVHYRRLIDPVWYFGPLQRLAAGLSAEYLIGTVIARDDHG